MNTDYISNEVDAKMETIINNENVYDVGNVVNVKDFIVEISGFDNVMFYEKINIANKAIGYVNCINEDVVVVALLKITEPIVVGDLAYSSNELFTGQYSESSMGRIVDLFGEDKLSSKTFDDLVDIPIERKTIPIMDRGTVNRPLLTGIAGIDLMYPIGKGQRQLIIGDKRTGKTQIGLDTIANQNGKNVLCFYVAIGKTKKEVKNIYFELMKRGALSYTTIITAFNDELPPVISLIPYFALSVCENKMMQGFDVLVVIDDLKRHAEAYREISLIAGKTPGRDAYPADIFYTHSRLLEKGCQHKDGGSITILPIVETKGGDITDYISTNIISITDGQIVLSAKSFQKGEKPAINYGLSVSRLGGQVQEASIKAVGNIVRRMLLSYLETRSVYELVNMDEMSPELRNQFMEGKIILNNLIQYKYSPKTPQEMISMFEGVVDGSVLNKSENTTSESTTNDTASEIQNVGVVAEVPEGGFVNDVINNTPENISGDIINDAGSAVPMLGSITEQNISSDFQSFNDLNNNGVIEVDELNKASEVSEEVNATSFDLANIQNMPSISEVNDINQALDTTPENRVPVQDFAFDLGAIPTNNNGNENSDTPEIVGVEENISKLDDSNPFELSKIPMDNVNTVPEIVSVEDTNIDSETTEENNPFELGEVAVDNNEGAPEIVSIEDTNVDSETTEETNPFELNEVTPDKIEINNEIDVEEGEVEVNPFELGSEIPVIENENILSTEVVEENISITPKAVENSSLDENQLTSPVENEEINPFEVNDEIVANDLSAVSVESPQLIGEEEIK